jgi:hypothetical protein
VRSSAASVTLRVLSDNVILPGLSKALPKREYEGHIDWEHSDRDDGESHMIAVQIIVPSTLIVELGPTRPLTSMDCEVLRFLQSGDINQAE